MEDQDPMEDPMEDLLQVPLRAVMLAAEPKAGVRERLVAAATNWVRIKSSACSKYVSGLEWFSIQFSYTPKLNLPESEFLVNTFLLR